MDFFLLKEICAFYKTQATLGARNQHQHRIRSLHRKSTLLKKLSKIETQKHSSSELHSQNLIFCAVGYQLYQPRLIFTFKFSSFSIFFTKSRMLDVFFFWRFLHSLAFGIDNSKEGQFWSKKSINKIKKRLQLWFSIYLQDQLKFITF